MLTNRNTTRIVIVGSALATILGFLVWMAAGGAANLGSPVTGLSASGILDSGTTSVAKLDAAGAAADTSARVGAQDQKCVLGFCINVEDISLKEAWARIEAILHDWLIAFRDFLRTSVKIESNTK